MSVFALGVSPIGAPVQESNLRDLLIVDLSGESNPASVAASMYVRMSLNVIKRYYRAGNITRREYLDLRAELLDFRSGNMERWAPGSVVNLPAAASWLFCAKVA